MTKLPGSIGGANVGLGLPRNRVAAEDAKRPRTTSAASMTCHLRSISLGFGLYVRTGLPCLIVGGGACPAQRHATARRNGRQAYPWVRHGLGKKVHHAARR